MSQGSHLLTALTMGTNRANITKAMTRSINDGLWMMYLCAKVVK